MQSEEDCKYYPVTYNNYNIKWDNGVTEGQFIKNHREEKQKE